MMSWNKIFSKKIFLRMAVVTLLLFLNIANTVNIAYAEQILRVAVGLLP